MIKIGQVPVSIPLSGLYYIHCIYVVKIIISVSDSDRNSEFTDLCNGNFRDVMLV